ncbi:MFS transporter [Microbacterium sp. NPDC077057]|uniref:MFS transporter n=1 Tax=unclassified Microbacterium TaxID=2609290 RepID=UPI0034442CAB
MTVHKGTLGLYVLTATLVRSADAGAAVGFVLLASAAPLPPEAAGFLVAALTAPHLAGPFVAPLLDRARRPLRVLFPAFLIFGLSIGAAAMAVTAGWLLAAIALSTVAGLCGPLHTGGLSSRLAELVGHDDRRQRRAQGLDALTYGLGAAGGPLVVTASGALSPLIGVLAMAAAAIAGAVALLTLPVARSMGSTQGVATVGSSWRNAALLLTTGPLRRVLISTSLTAIALGAIPILALAVTATRELGGAQVAGLLATAFGIGTLLGSLVVTAAPLRGSPERAVAAATAVVAGALALCALAPTVSLAAAAFAVTGAASAVQFTASLAARVEYAASAARAQVFMTMAGVKVACSAGGVALAGLVAPSAPSTLLVAAVGVVALAAVATAADHLLSVGMNRRRPSGAISGDSLDEGGVLRIRDR